ncbi:MAG: hypothetical protein PHU51_02465, partial [Candidatus Nanoarchaeia archaeon]|nr:hypothetical protein [Candidatus Nanoarchaeia archaeon]
MVKGEFILKASFVLVLLLINIGSVLSAYDTGAFCSPRCQCPYACMEVPRCENIDISHFNSVDQTYSGEYVELTAPLEGGVSHDEFYADPYQTEYRYDLNYNYYTSQFEHCNYVWRCTEVLELEECYDDTEYAVDGICSINYEAIDPEDIGDKFCSDTHPGAIFTTVSTNCGPRIMIYKSCSATGGICVQNEGGEPFCTSVCGNNYKSQNEVCDDEVGWFPPFTDRGLSKGIVSVINGVELSSYWVSGVANDANTCENYQPDQLNCEWKLHFGTTYGCYCTEKLTEEKLIETCEENGYFWDDETSKCVVLNED